LTLSLFYSKISISIIGGKREGLAPQNIKEGCPFYKEDLGSYERARTQLKIHKDSPPVRLGRRISLSFQKLNSP